MGYGFRPLVINWMESRLLKVVFPDDDGDVFKEHLRWNYIMGLNNVGDFNIACEEGHATDLMTVRKSTPVLHESRFLRGGKCYRLFLLFSSLVELPIIILWEVLPTIITVICSQVQDLSTYSTSLNTTSSSIAGAL